MLMLTLLLAAAPLKIQNAETLLFESVEAAQECVEISAAWERYQRQKDARADAMKKAEAKCGLKPYSEVKLSELSAWKAAREKCAGEIAEAEGLPAQKMPLALERDVCGPATTAVLSKGIEVTVLGKDAVKRMRKVRVETGRAVGKVGWVFESDTTPPNP